MQTIRAAEARANFAALLRRVSENKERIVIERRGKPHVAVVPVEDLAPTEAGKFRGYRGIGTNITEPKRAEEALRESEARYRTLANLAPVGIFHTDARGLVTYVNERWCEIGGLSSEQAMGTGWIASVHPEDREWIAAEWDEAVRNERMYRSEYRCMHRDGTFTWCDVQAVAETDAVGKLAGYVGCVTDITERRRAEEALRRAHDELELRVEERTAELRKANEALIESEARLAEAHRIAKIGAWAWDEIEDRLLYGSALADDLFGVPQATLSDSLDSFLAMVHRDDRARVRAVMEQAKKDRTGYDVEYKIVRPDGETRYVEEIAQAELDDAGELVRSIGTVQDITERKRAEEALRESEARLMALLDNYPSEVLLMDTDGRYVLINQEYDRRYGLTLERAKGKSASDFFPADVVDPGTAAFREVLETRRAVTIEERLHYGGTQHTNVLVQFPILAGDGELLGVGGIGTDITDRKRAEEALREREARLRHAQRMAMLGHWEWRTESDGLQLSPEAASILGVPPEKPPISFAEYARLTHPDDVSGYDAIVGKAIEDRAEYEAEYRVVRPDGEVRFVRELGEPLYEAGGEAIGIRGTIQDVTEQQAHPGAADPVLEAGHAGGDGDGLGA